MKIILLGLLSLFSSIALACPNLSGSFFKCTTGDRTLDDLSGINQAKLEIAQNGNDITAQFMGATTKIKIGETVQTTHYDEDEMATINSKITASCSGDVLNMQEESKIVYDWGDTLDSNTDSEIYLIEAGKKIVMDMTTTEPGNRTNMTITCKRR